MYPNGDMNDADAPNMTQYAMRTTSAPVCSAAFMAMGKIRAAAALLVTMLLIKNVARYTAPNNPASFETISEESS